ncbi:hypothetical protein GCM10010423_65180 [Streptomyces levis]|uniref:HK97 gp10 family phage protein n=1 Tax=Streptomyces levis TaxID=285566 RepID=A0ABN3P310_9ACTN
MGFDISGDLGELIAMLETAEQEVAEEAEGAVEDSIKEIFEATQRRVPKKTRALMESGRIEWKERSGNVRSASIIYGNSDTDRIGVFYAAAVHEILDAQHDPPTGAKYVELPLEEGTQRFKERLEKAAKNALGKKTI